MPLNSFSAALSTKSDWREATSQLCAEIGTPPDTSHDIVVVFISTHHQENVAAIADQIRTDLGCSCLIGCTGESIIGGDREVEDGPAIAVWIASLPGITLTQMHLTYDRTPDGGSILGWPDATLDDWPTGSALLLLGDPFSFPTDALLAQLNTKQPGIPVIGGNASGAQTPGHIRLVVGEQIVDEGAVGILMQGDTGIRTLVSQGCRPIGDHFVITKAEQNVIHELGGKPALIQLKHVFDTLSEPEQALVQTGLHLGRVVSEYQDRFDQGDFLIRNVLGIDPENGTIAVADYMRPGQTVQFQIRDEESADAELQFLLQELTQREGFTPGGGILFNCNGRGTRLFSQPNHDASAIAQSLGNIPLAGFFAAGEIGPVGNENFVHGFTASLIVFPK